MSITYVLEDKAKLVGLANTFRNKFGLDNSPLSLDKMGELLRNSYTPVYDFVFGVKGDTYKVLRYNGSVSDVYIPPVYKGRNVTAVGSNAFDGLTVNSITLPNTVLEIERSAFANVHGVDNIVIPENVETIGANVFENSSIERVTFETIPNEVDINTFAGSNVSEIRVPWQIDEVSGAPWGAPETCTVYYSYDTIEDAPTSITLKEIIDRTITELNIPNTVTEIGDYAFYGCESLTKVFIPNSVTYISPYAFAGCCNLETIELEEGFTDRYSLEGQCLIDKEYVENGVQYTAVIFGLKPTADAPISIPNYVTAIGPSAFTKNKLTSIHFPKSVVYIGNSAFRECPELTFVSMHYAPIKEIGGHAFYACEKLEDVKFPDADWVDPDDSVHTEKVVTTLWDAAFGHCYSLKGSYNPIYEHYLLGLSSSGITHIPAGAFTHCYSLDMVALPSNCTRVEEGAFKTCADTIVRKTGLKRILLPIECRSIEFEAFCFCQYLEDVDFSPCKKLEIIEDRAFYDCRALTELSLPASLSVIGASAFASVANGPLKTLNIPIDSTLSVIGDHAFANQKTLSGYLNLPRSVSEIGSHAFTNCNGITGVSLNNSMTVLHDNTFGGCPLIKEITLPKNLQRIGNYVLQWTAVKTLDIPITCREIADYAFTNARSLTAINVPWSEDEVAGAPWGAWYGTGVVKYNQNTSEGEFTGTLYRHYTSGAKSYSNETSANGLEIVLYINGEPITGTSTSGNLHSVTYSYAPPSVPNDIVSIQCSIAVSSSVGSYGVTYNGIGQVDATCISTEKRTAAYLNANYKIKATVATAGGGESTEFELEWED